MLGESRSGRDVLRHFSRYLERTIRAFRQDSDHHVLKGDNPEAELDQLGVAHVGNVRMRFVSHRRDCVAFVVPP